MLLAIVLALFTISTIAETHACPGMAGGAAGVAHEASSAAVMTAATATTSAEIASGGGICCGGGLHANGAGCSHGCCASCSAAVVGAVSVVVFQAAVLDHALRPERRVAWAIADRNFRPPPPVS